MYRYVYVPYMCMYICVCVSLYSVGLPCYPQTPIYLIFLFMYSLPQLPTPLLLALLCTFMSFILFPYFNKIYR